MSNRNYPFPKDAYDYMIEESEEHMKKQHIASIGKFCNTIYDYVEKLEREINEIKAKERELKEIKLHNERAGTKFRYPFMVKRYYKDPESDNHISKGEIVDLLEGGRHARKQNGVLISLLCLDYEDKQWFKPWHEHGYSDTDGDLRFYYTKNNL